MDTKIPIELTEEINRRFNSDAKEAAVRELNALIASEHQTHAYWVWTGSAFGDEDLELDVFVLGESCLYNYFRRSDGTAGASATFLRGLTNVSLSLVNDDRSPLVLSYDSISGQSSGRIFGKIQDRDRLEFQARLVQLSLVAK